MTYELDTCGLLCPLPVLKARKRLSSLASGDILALLCDDPAAAIDVPHFCNENGHQLTKTADEGQGKTLYLIKKA
ncbi:MAG: sulfurtransferase TusA family protein [Marinovum sp.]|jgi:tRNA 2-thiouridine synthesizing protein A|nr:sulfurtransferase TusA family protein [Marinovum sp.]